MALPFAIFGIDNDGIGIAVNLLVIFLIAVWVALVYWSYADARRRVEDPFLVACSAVAAAIFPFAGSIVYAVVRPPETIVDRYEQDLEIRAAELRVELLERAMKSGPSSGAFAATVAGELSGSQPAPMRPSGSPPRPSQTQPRGPSAGQVSGRRPAPPDDDERPRPSTQRVAQGLRAPARESEAASRPAAPRPPQPRDQRD